MVILEPFKVKIAFQNLLRWSGKIRDENLSWLCAARRGTLADTGKGAQDDNGLVFKGAGTEAQGIAVMKNTAGFGIGEDTMTVRKKIGKLRLPETADITACFRVKGIALSEKPVTVRNKNIIRRMRRIMFVALFHETEIYGRIMLVQKDQTYRLVGYFREIVVSRIINILIKGRGGAFRV